MSYKWEGNPGVVLQTPEPWATFSYYKSIDDVIGTPRSQRVKPTFQRSLIYRGEPYHPWYGDYGLYVHPLNQVGPYIRADDVLSIIPLPPDSVRQAATERAIIRFAEQFPQEFSASEFSSGFLDLKQMLPRLEKSLLRSLAGLYLQEKFAWESLLSDLNVLSTLLTSTSSRLEYLKRTYGKPVKLYHREEDIYSPSSIDTLYYEPTRSWGTRVTPIHYRCDFNAGASLVQELDHLDGALGWFQALLGASGLNNPLRSAWEVLPLSFVVDWFANVSTHLARLGTVKQAVGWNVFNVSSSLTTTVIFQVDQVNTNQWGSVTPQEYPLGELVYREYRRFVGLPLDLGVFTPSGLTPQQLVLFAAMLAAKSR
jgi:hypothetical protein